MAWTLADIKQYCRDNDAEDGGSLADRNYGRIANDANFALHGSGEWEFDRKLNRLAFRASKSDGTVSIAVDGTALSGVGTAFVAGDDEGYMRYQGEDVQYRVTAVGGTTSLTMEAYQGAAALSGVTYVLTNDRQALDTLFRCMETPDQEDDSDGLKTVTLDTLHWWRMYGREVSTPRMCAVEWFTTSTVGGRQAPFLWVYPAPSTKTVIEFYAYMNPVELTSSGDGISAPQQADAAYRAFLDAYLLQKQGKRGEFESQLAIAVAMAKRDLAQFRTKRKVGARRMWSPDNDPPGGDGRRRARMGIAPGEPAYE